MTARSEAIVVVSDDQRADPQQLNDTNELIRATLDNVVRRFASGRACYGGMSVAQDVSGFRCVVGEGTLYVGGAGYDLPSDFVVDLASACNAVPVDKVARVAILANGFENPEAEKTTVSKLDPDKKPARPGIDPWPLIDVTLPTRKTRTVEISKRVGDPDGDLPAFGESLTLIAELQIAKTGIVEIDQNDDARIYSLDAVGLDMKDLMIWRALVEPQISGILGTVAGLAQQIAKLNFGADVARLQEQINDLWKRVQNAGNTAVLQNTDYFVDTKLSSPDATGYNARISEGLRFPAGATTDVAIVPQNALADSVRVMDNGKKLMPAWTDAVSAASAAFSSTARIRNRTFIRWNSYNAYATTLFVRGFGVVRVRWNRRLLPIAVAQLLSAGDPNLIFAISPSDLLYDYAWGDWRLFGPELLRRPGFWRDIAARTYWTRVLQTIALAGTPVIAQPYRQPRAEMIAAVDVPLKKYSTTGDLRFVVLGDLNGNPDPNQVFADVTIAAANLGADKTTVPMPYPIPKAANQTLWFFTLTSGTHSIAALTPPIVSRDAQPVLGGAPKVWTGNGWLPLSNIAELGFVVHRAAFGGGVIRIPCNPLTLAGAGGGIDAVDIVAPALISAGNAVDYETQINGATVPIDEPSGAHPLTGAQATLPLTMIMTFTDALAPIVDISGQRQDGTWSGSYARLSRAGTSINHITDTKSPSVAVGKIVEEILLDNWDASVHTYSVKLQTGSGFATEVDPTAVYDEPRPGGTIMRRLTWSLGTAVTVHRLRRYGGTTDQTKTYSGREARLNEFVS